MRILLIDDHTLFRAGLRMMLQELMPGAEILEAGSCPEALSRFQHMMSDEDDLIMLDLNMPGTSGTQSLSIIKDAFPANPVVVVSGEDAPGLIRESLALGAVGFLPKSATPEVMQAALRVVLSKGIYIPQQALSPGKVDQPHLTQRQLGILREALKGTPNKVIAHRLSISEGTVKSHLSAVFRTLGVRNRTEALYHAARIGLHL